MKDASNPFKLKIESNKEMRNKAIKDVRNLFRIKKETTKEIRDTRLQLYM